MSPFSFVLEEPPRSELSLDGVEILGTMLPGYERVLTADAVSFVAELVRGFRPALKELLAARVSVQAEIDQGRRPTMLPATEEIRSADWTVAPCPQDLWDRRVEITGPVDRKMIINALNSGAKVFMADFEDSNSPTWTNNLDGQCNLMDAARGTITYEHPTKGLYTLDESVATLMVRPRGLHLQEAHLVIDGEPAPAGLVDFGLFFFHNAQALLDRGSGPYFYLPKLQHHLEARWWNQVFVHAQSVLGIANGTIKATVLLEHVLAAFQMNEILWELRDHSAGLNCGRWDYIFSYIKTFRNDPAFLVPDRSSVGMDRHFLKSYTELVIQTCHRRGVHAMGGMAAQIPIKNDPAANRVALDKVVADKLREVTAGHDGTWVAHPGLVKLATDVFDAHMPRPNQLDRLREEVQISADDLLRVPQGTVSLAGLRLNVRIGLQYLESWLRGNGCVPIDNLMEDAATAEISRAQIWQWLKHGVVMTNGETVTAALVAQVLDDTVEALVKTPGPASGRFGRLYEARELFGAVATSETFPEFLTLPAYGRITTLLEQS
jgi:malate synthase